MGIKTAHLVTKRRYNFTAIQLGQTVTAVALRSASVDYGETAELLVRVHDVDIGSSSTVEVVAKPISITPEEPETDYLGAAVATVTLNSSTTAGSLQLSSLTAPFGAAIQLQVSGTCATAMDPVDATISVSLVCKG